MLGKLVVDGTPEDSVPFDNPNQKNLVQEVSMKVSHQNFSMQTNMVDPSGSS